MGPTSRRYRSCGCRRRWSGRTARRGWRRSTRGRPAPRPRASSRTSSVAADSRYHLAQYNLARLLAPLDDPMIADFVADLHRVNELGDRSPGFVWRLQTEDGTSTSVRVRGGPLIVVNLTVWESVEALFDFTYRSGHAEVYRRRRQWFEP